MFKGIKKPYLVLLILVPLIAVVYSIINKPITLQCNHLTKGTVKINLKEFSETFYSENSYRVIEYIQFNPKRFKYDWDKENEFFRFKSTKVSNYNKEFASYAVNIPIKTLNQLSRIDVMTKPKEMKVKVSIDRVEGKIEFDYYDGQKFIKLIFLECDEILVKSLPKIKTKF
jgi:hypothetical protein